MVPPWEAGLIATGARRRRLPRQPRDPRRAADRARAEDRPQRRPRAPGRSSSRRATAARVWLSILGISWFFAVGAVLLAQFAPLVGQCCQAQAGGRDAVPARLLGRGRARLAGGEPAAQGRGLGPLRADLGAGAGRLHDRPVALDPRLSCPPRRARTSAGSSPTPGSWRILVDLPGIAFAGGMFIVPLYAILQTHSPAGGALADHRRQQHRQRRGHASRGRDRSSPAARGRGVGVPGLIVGMLGFATLVVALISCWLLPETVIKALVRAVLRLLYRVEVTGAREHAPAGRAAPWWWSTTCPSSTACCSPPSCPASRPSPSTRGSRSAWWVKPFLGLFDAFPVDPTNPMSAKAMVKAVQRRPHPGDLPGRADHRHRRADEGVRRPGHGRRQGRRADRPGADRRRPISRLSRGLRGKVRCAFPEDPADHPAAAPLRHHGRDERARSAAPSPGAGSTTR